MNNGTDNSIQQKKKNTQIQVELGI